MFPFSFILFFFIEFEYIKPKNRNLKDFWDGFEKYKEKKNEIFRKITKGSFKFLAYFRLLFNYKVIRQGFIPGSSLFL